MLILIVLHPYYKMDYIKLEWGGAEEQEKEIDESNLGAKNWVEEAMKIVETEVREQRRFSFCMH